MDKVTEKVIGSIQKFNSKWNIERFLYFWLCVSIGLAVCPGTIFGWGVIAPMINACICILCILLMKWDKAQGNV